MIQAKIFKSEELYTGFGFSGHSGYADSGEDIVCAAVSSAVQLTVNMLGALNYKVDASAGENEVVCNVADPDVSSSNMILSLKLHMESILDEFPDTINITISEV